MADQSTIAIYGTMTEAEAAIRKLADSGYPVSQISIIAKDLESESEVHGFVTTGDVAKTGAGTGAWVGGLFGLLAGAALFWIPGIGPIAALGAIAFAIEGAAVGAVGGGILGALVGWGVSKEHVIKYEQAVTAGKYVLVAHGAAAEVAKAQQILAGTSAEEVNVHAEPVAA